MDISVDNLVERSQGGDREAYAELIRRHYKAVYLLCLGLLGSEHDAEDAAQEALLRGYTQIGTLRDARQYGAWIRRIARNHCINCLRRRRTEEEFDEQMAATGADAAERACEHVELRRAIGRLPMELRLPLVMYYFDGRNVKAVAECLRISPSGVYAKLRLATRRLCDMLGGPGGDL